MENSVEIKINPRLYPLEVIYSAAYVFLDKAYITLDGDPEKEIIVKLKPKQHCKNEKLKEEFKNELVNYCFYKTHSEKYENLRTTILQRALATNLQEDLIDEVLENMEEDEDFEDVEKIAVPWEEKYGKKKKKKK